MSGRLNNVLCKQQHSQSTFITVGKRVLVHRQVLTLSWGTNHHYYWTPSDCTCMHAVKKGRRLENKKLFELKSRGYRDGIKRKETR